MVYKNAPFHMNIYIQHMKSLSTQSIINGGAVVVQSAGLVWYRVWCLMSSSQALCKYWYIVKP
jgi:hypothetical protein